VIAADGIRSTVRARIFGDGAPVFSGMTAYRAVLDRQRALDLHPEGLDRYWIGPDRHGVAYWLSAGRRLAVTLAVRGAEPSEESWTAEAPPEEVLATVNGWDAGLRRRIGRCERFIKTAVYVRAPLGSWSHGRLALLGDAAHAMEPALGQGASQAVEDAYVLAECLRDDPSNPVVALRRYETARRTRATDQQGAAAAAMTSFFLPDGDAQRTRDAQWRELPKTYRFGPRQPIWTYDARDALEQALSPG
jgi:salicylate hydroxylase